MLYWALARGYLLKFSQFQESLNQGELSEERRISSHRWGNLNFIRRDREEQLGAKVICKKGVGA